MAQDSKNVFSISAAIQFLTTDYLNKSDTDQRFNRKVGYRRAGKPISYSFKSQKFGSEFHAEWIGIFNASYQFIGF